MRGDVYTIRKRSRPICPEEQRKIGGKYGDNYMVLQRYDLSLQDLQRLNWQISYPPT